jgi:hypothetical protein
VEPGQPGPVAGLDPVADTGPAGPGVDACRVMHRNPDRRRGGSGTLAAMQSELRG